MTLQKRHKSLPSRQQRRKRRLSQAAQAGPGRSHVPGQERGVAGSPVPIRRCRHRGRHRGDGLDPACVRGLVAPKRDGLRLDALRFTQAVHAAISAFVSHSWLRAQKKNPVLQDRHTSEFSVNRKASNPLLSHKLHASISDCCGPGSFSAGGLGASKSWSDRRSNRFNCRSRMICCRLKADLLRNFR